MKGLGPETGDAILLYAGRKPLFVVEADSRRILARHGMLATGSTYVEAQDFVHQRLAPDAEVDKEFHALRVEVGKRHCRKEAPRGCRCALELFLPGPQPAAHSARNLALQLV